MKPNRGAIRSFVAGLRAVAIASAGLLTLTTLVLWQQSRLPDYSGWQEGMQITGSGFRTPVLSACFYVTTTPYAKLPATHAPMETRKVADRAIAVQCTASFGEESRLRLIISDGFLEIAYCWFIPSGAPVTQMRRDLRLVSFHSGYAPEALGPLPLIDVTPLPPPPVLVAKSIRMHLLLVAFLFGACAAGPLLRGPVRRWHRARRGLCVRCGYDLTGNISGVCPECGTRIPGVLPSSQAV